jgi:hypothetical protein
MVAEALEETVSLDGKLAHTLPALFLRPGAATRHHIEGRRASFTSPLKLYLFASFAFFLAVALGPDFGLRMGGTVTSADDGGEEAGEVSPVQASEGSRAELRAAGSVGGLLADRLETLQALPPREAQRRLNEALVENVARAMFVLVPLMALALLALHARRGLTYTDHLVAATHAQTVTFALLLPGVALGSEALTFSGLGIAAGHLFLAMRRVYRTSWAGTALRWLCLSTVYAVAVGFAVVGATVAAVLTS